MTPQELLDIDKKVAEAIGGIESKGRWKFPWGGYASVSTARTHDEDGLYWDEERDIWKPSVSWDDAMFAAEKAGLFETPEDSPDTICLIRNNGHYGVVCVRAELKELPGIHSWWDVTESESGPLAVSLAILKLKGVK